MKCARCQHDNPSHANFCLKCGTPLGSTVTPARSYADLKADNERFQGALREALEQQTATAEILRVISSSPTSLQPVLDAVAQNAARVCEGQDATVVLVEGASLRRVANSGGMMVLRASSLRSDVTQSWAVR